MPYTTRIDCGLQAPGQTSECRGRVRRNPRLHDHRGLPADVDPAFARQEFDGVAAGLVSQNGIPMLRVLAGQLKSGSGDAFVHSYLENLSTETRDGSTVVIAYVASGSPPATVDDALTEILDKLR